MNKTLLKTFLPIAALLVLNSCFDDNYDLDNIDKTSQIKVNGLVIPVKLDKVMMGDILDIDDDEDNLIVTFTGPDNKTYYAIKTKGEFNPDPVYIAPFSAYTNDVSLKIENLSASLTKAFNDIQLPEANTTFNYEAYNIDEALLAVYRMDLKNPMNIAINIDCPFSATITDLKIMIPAEFEAYYNGSRVIDGVITIPQVNTNETIQGITVNAIETGDISISHNNSSEIPDFQYEGTIGIIGGNLSLSEISSIPDYINFTFMLGELEVNKISGNIKEIVEVPPFEGVNLSDLPDFLREGNSSLVLANPQLYITVDDPIGANVSTAISIVPLKENNVIDRFYQNFGLTANGVIGTYTILLSPDSNTANNPFDQYYVFSDLGNILKGNGNGLPNELSLSLSDVTVEGDVEITLGGDILLGGSYEFFAPLDMDGSYIHYEKTETGFFDKETDSLKIDLLSISASVNTNIPYNITLSVTPLDKNGQPLKNYESQPVTIPANASGYSFDLNVKNATGVDGITFKAEVAAESGTLSNDQYIQLDNIKAKVTGAYITEFD